MKKKNESTKWNKAQQTHNINEPQSPGWQTFDAFSNLQMWNYFVTFSLKHHKLIAKENL